MTAGDPAPGPAGTPAGDRMRGPGDAGLAGGPTDEVWDLGMQNERTALAWHRTSLALLVAVLLVARLGLRRWPAPTLALVAVAVPLCLALLRWSSRRYRRAHAALHDTLPGPDGRLPFAATSAVALLGLAAVVAITAGGFVPP
jgi:putative membrane protein